MDLTSILAVLDGGDGDEALLQNVLSFARDKSLFLHAICVRPGADQAVPVVADGLSGGAIGEIVQALEASNEARIASAEAVFKRLCTDAGVPTAGGETLEPGFRVFYESIEGSVEEVVASRGRRCDLIAVARPVAAEDRLYSPALETALFSSGRPVLVLPPRVCASIGREISVAWNDSGPAARALAGALPLLRGARSVELITVEDGGCEALPDDLQPYLKRHGVAAGFRRLQPDYRPLGEQMLEEAKENGADLLVMGAYGHSRLRELVLGGVTRQVLAKADVALLMAH